MINLIKYKTFNRDKSIDELHYYTSKWMVELGFVDIELPFLKRLIKTYPFKGNIPNLFENIQIFISKLDQFGNDKSDIIKEIIEHNNQLQGMLECNDMSCDDFYLNEYDALAKKIFNYLQSYQNLKMEIYIYFRSVLSNE